MAFRWCGIILNIYGHVGWGGEIEDGEALVGAATHHRRLVKGFSLQPSWLGEGYLDGTNGHQEVL